MAPRKLKRDTELSTIKAVNKQLLDVFDEVQEGFQDQRERSDSILDNWDLYNQKLTDKQFYSGNSRVFLPYVHDAVNARKTRFANQVFPQSGRYVEVISGEEMLPNATMSLLEGYVRDCRIQTEIMPPLLKNGDIEGQYSLYVSWSETKRRTTRRVKKADVEVAGMEMPELGEHDDYEETDEEIGCPDVEVIHDCDLLVLPVTAKSVDEAIALGGSVTVMRRWTKARIRRAMRDGSVTGDAGDTLIKEMQKAQRGRDNNATDKLLDAAGVKNSGREAQVYETWTKIEVGGQDRLCVAFYGGDDNVLGCKPCPYWCDRVPVISCATEKQASVFKGKPPVEAVADLQYLANDNINEGADTAHFSAMPIVMTDPEKNPKVSTMVLGLAAVWETSPQDTQFAQFPELWANAMSRSMACQAQIFQTLGVNPSMIPQSTGGDNKRNQAEIANEQQVDVLTVADAVTVLEEGILTPLIERFAEYDHQFREKAVTIEVYGEVGVRAEMEEVEPIQMGRRWVFRWFGVEQAKNAAQLQQQIAGMNVLKGIPPQMLPDYEINLAPIIVQMVEGLFGPRLAPLVLVRKTAFTIGPDIENEMLKHGFMVAVHEADDDEMHLMAHMEGMQGAEGMEQQTAFRDHVMKHQAQMIAKQQAQQMQQAPPAGVPGSPGGAGPGVAGTPAPGSQPESPPGFRGPPGMIHADQMPSAGAVGMPRKM